MKKAAKTKTSLRARKLVAGSDLQHIFPEARYQKESASVFDVIHTNVFHDKIPFHPHLTDKEDELQGCASHTA